MEKYPNKMPENATAVGVRLDDGLFDATFTVISYTAYIAGQEFQGTGPYLSSQIQDALARVRSGERIAFENVKVLDPAETRRTINGLSLAVY